MPKTDLRTARGWTVITGPTSGIGHATALAMAKQGPLILVSRDRAKLEALEKAIKRKGQQAVSVVCDISDIKSVRRAAAEIAALNLPITGVINNAGIRQEVPTRSAQGWDMTFATNHLGPFALTEALLPHLADGGNVLFVCSAVEDPTREPARSHGFRGARYISAEASARGEWKAGGSKVPGFDSYATSKQCNLATVFEFARAFPSVRFSGIEPGVNPNTGLSRTTSARARFMRSVVVPLLMPILQRFMPYLRTPKQAARAITKIMLDRSAPKGTYYDERGAPKLASEQVRDHEFQERVVAETRALLATVS